MTRSDPSNEALDVFYRQEVLDHDTGHGFFEAQVSELLPVAEPHPENADRIRNMKGVLDSGPISASLNWHCAEAADEELLLGFHTRDYIESLAALDPGVTHWLSGTTPLGPRGFEISKIAAGVAAAALDHVWQGRGKAAYALVRPPGHHAQPSMADGYCFINNIGVAVEHARKKGLRRAAIIDWDVHHGNGTQEGFYRDPSILTVSLHMGHGAWGQTHPQTGAVDETGLGPGRGKNMNLPLPCGAGDALYLEVFDQIVAPALEAHRPEVIVVAAGQDASQFDPNGRMCLTMSGFNELGRRVRELASRLCQGKLALVQEGGYAVSYASYCLHATLEGVLGRRGSLADPIGYMQEQITDTTQVVEDLVVARERAMSGSNDFKRVRLD